MKRDDVRDRMRDGSATDFERRLLDAVANEKPSPELRQRMAVALGVPPGGPPAGSSTGGSTPPAPAGFSAGSGSTGLLPWIAASALGLVVSGAVVGTWVWRDSPSEGRTSASVPTQRSGMAPASTEVAPAFPSSPPADIATPAPLRRGRASSPPNDLREQIALVDAARASLAAGAGERALDLLREYRDRYPSGGFRPEAAALRIEALAKLGRSTEARALAERFIAEFGRGPLADRVARAAGLGQP
jgi:hypothetical protein